MGNRAIAMMAGLLAASGVLMISGPASGAPEIRTTAITLRGIDRLGHGSALVFAAVVPLGPQARQPEYRTNAAGRVRLPRGRYVVGVDIETAATKSSPASATLGALILRVADRAKTVTADARRGTRVHVSLQVPGASEVSLAATVCAGVNSASSASIQAAVTSVGDGEQLYTIPSRTSSAQFGIASAWTGPDGSPYLLGGTRAGVPASPRFSFRPSDLGTLVLRAASGASEASSGFAEFAPETECGPQADVSDQPKISVPGQLSYRVSAGDWFANFAPNDSNDDTTSVVRAVLPRHRVAVTVGAAVRGPGQASLPVFDRFLRGRADFYFSTIDLFQDPATVLGAECCAQGTIAVRAQGKVLKKSKIDSLGASPFEADLSKPGRYTVDISATRRPPHHGVSPAILSTRIHLTWKFKATSKDLNADHIAVPVSVTTFRPAGLNLRNDAGPAATTPVRLTIRPGQSERLDAIKSVEVQASYDGGATWQAVPVSGKGVSWLARVKDPAGGFVSLRSTVTDVQGNTTIETIDRAYGIS